MNITKAWLDSEGACIEGKEWFSKQRKTGVKAVANALIKDGKFDWCSWLLVRLLSHRSNVLYAAYAAKQCLSAYEKQYPEDSSVREAIEAAEKWAKQPNEANRIAARYAAESAESALSAAASAAWSAARSAKYAAESAALSAAESAGYAAAYARSAAWSTAGSAAWSTAWKKALKYGLKLYTKGKV